MCLLVKRREYCTIMDPVVALYIIVPYPLPHFSLKVKLSPPLARVLESSCTCISEEKFLCFLSLVAFFMLCMCCT